MPDSRDPQVQEILLRALRYSVREAIGPAVSESMSLERLHDFMHENMVYALTAELLAEKIEGQEIRQTARVRQEFTVPDGRLQRWKERHWERRWCRWSCFGRAVRYIHEERRTEVALVVAVEDYATFPRSSYIPPPSSALGAVVFKRLINSEVTQKEL